MLRTVISFCTNRRARVFRFSILFQNLADEGSGKDLPYQGTIRGHASIMSIKSNRFCDNRSIYL